MVINGQKMLEWTYASFAPLMIKPGFVKSTSAAFQVKAEKFPVSNIEKEIVSKGVIRPAIKDLEKSEAHISTAILAKTS
jgi:hypothetical protein